jgi:NAD(P)H-dependent flavin oxidoreductase YrpB (nitropropane dioxygenase family)
MAHSGVPLPTIIQGGMGVGVSSWQLARAVSRCGEMGVVSGTALDTVWGRRLQDGDPDGLARRALAACPIPDLAQRVLDRWYRPDGRGGRPYTPTPRLALRSSQAADDLMVAGAFIEVWLAKEGHDGVVGVNCLEKIQMATPATAYGAILGGADYVLMGAGIPRDLPALLTALARNEPGGVWVDVAGGERQWHQFDPRTLTDGPLPAVRRPDFLAIVSSHVLASYLYREESTRPDGYVVEGPSAGGHNAPPRGRLQLDESGQPVYGPRDDADLRAMAAIGLPFWLAGGFADPKRVREAVEAGATGVQIGTLFALAEESGLLPDLRGKLLAGLRDGTLDVRTEPSASPTGFPFKVAQITGTMSEPQVYAARPRLCDLGYLRTPYQREGGAIGYRCAAEPADVYVRKGGDLERTVGAACLCNALTADIGLGQERKDGYVEQPLLTLGSDLDGARALDAELARQGAVEPGWSAERAVRWLLSEVRSAKATDPAA